MDSRSVMPPMSTTSLPSSAEPVEPSVPTIKPPILASDILREEVAPLAPAGTAMRRWLLAVSASYASLAIASFEGLTPYAHLAVSASLVTVAAATVAWLAPVPYAARAGLAMLAGLLPLLLGAEDKGPLARLGSEGEVQAGAELVLVILLPAALFFRAQYRAFLAARGFLVVALALAVPAVFFLGRGALAEGTPLTLRLADVLVITSVLTSFAGFLGPETTGACTLWGAVLLLALPARQLVASGLRDASASQLGSAAAVAVGEALAGTVASVGLYQLLAAALARRARLVDVHRIVGPSAEEQ
jgi:hypothetical protein